MTNIEINGASNKIIINNVWKKIYKAEEEEYITASYILELAK